MSEDEQKPDADRRTTQSGDAGLPDPDEVPPETIERLDAERAERLDPENRPDNVEIDNTDRTFDPAAGRFTDDPDYDAQERPFADGTSGA